MGFLSFLCVHLFVSFFYELQINERGANTDARSIRQTCVLLALPVVGLWQDWDVPVRTSNGTLMLRSVWHEWTHSISQTAGLVR